MPAFPRPRPLPPRRLPHGAAPARAGPHVEAHVEAHATSQVLPRATAHAEPVDPAPGLQPPPGPVDRDGWFARRAWQPFAFQRDVWDAVARGESGLLHATTGAGKTHAVWFAALGQALHARAPVQRDATDRAGRWTGAGPEVLWITPMRALAADTALALAQPLAELGLDWTVGLRTGDTPPAERARQDRSLPHALVTTPESLSLMLARADSPMRLGRVAMVVVDEWHELMGNKRGVQVAAGAREAAPPVPRAGGLGAVGDARQPGSRDGRAAVDGRRATGAGPAAQDAARRHAAARFDRALSLGRPPGPAHAAAGHCADRGQCQHAGVHEHPFAGRTVVPGDPGGAPGLGGPARAAPRLARPVGARVGRRRPQGRPAQGGACVRRAWTWAWISRRSSACCRSAAPRASRGCCSVPAAPGIHRGARRGSRWCRRTRWSCSRRRPRATRWRPGASSRARRRAGRWTCWCSTWSPSRWAPASCPTSCWPRSAAATPIAG